MTASLDKAQDIIRQAEESCQQAIHASTQDGAYEEIAGLARLGQRLSALAAEFCLDSGDELSPSGEHVEGRRSSNISRPAKATKTRRKPKGYPKFARIEDMLVKIGWSKSSVSEYTHKADLGVVNQLAEALNTKSKKRKPFPIEEVLPLKDTKNGKEIPGYLIYLCLAWLVEIGLVRKHGRKGYTVSSQTDPLPDAVEESWKKLERLSH